MRNHPLYRRHFGQYQGNQYFHVVKFVFLSCLSCLPLKTWNMNQLFINDSRQWQTLHGSCAAYIVHVLLENLFDFFQNCNCTSCHLMLSEWTWGFSSPTSLSADILWHSLFSSEAILPLVEDAFAHPVPPLPEGNPELQVRISVPLYAHLLANCYSDWRLHKWIYSCKVLYNSVEKFEFQLEVFEF